MKINKQIVILGGVVILALGVWFAYTLLGSDADMKNVDVMRNGSLTQVIVDDAVAYFPGVTGYFVRPETPGNYPGVVMIHENRGLRPEIKQSAETLAKEGYLVLAVDLLG